MKTMELLAAIGEVRSEYVQDILIPAEGMGAAKIRSFRRPLLIAAIIGLLMLMMGCAAYFYSLKQLVVIDHSEDVIATIEEDDTGLISDDIAESSQETISGPIVAEKVLSMQGYEGSPSYNALQEWLAYVTDYLIRNPEARFTNFQRPEAYMEYTCYSQEMVDKVDELCSKYGLHLLGKSLFITDAAGMEENGLSGVLSEEAMPRCFYGHLYQDGSFIASGELEFSGDYEKNSSIPNA